MSKTRNYETVVPENYVLVKHVDAKSDKKQAVVYTLLSFIPAVLMIPLLVMTASRRDHCDILREWCDGENLPALLAFCAAVIVYVVLHEVVHGVTYKCFTGSKLTFGMTLSVAFCGVPDIYVRKKASAAALVMPFLVFSILFSGLTAGLWYISPFYGVLAGAVLAIHLGGCVGDLHWTLLYLTRFRGCDTLMRDIGPEQWLYIPQVQAARRGIVPLKL